MKKITGVAVLVFAAVCLVGGCAAPRVADGGHRAASGAAEVYYEFHNAEPEAGVERTPLVFVHGWSCDHRHWDAQVEGLPHDRAMLVLDLPGYGRSSDGGAAHTMDLYADAVAAAMDDAGIDRAVLLGHSMGTPVIRQFYRHSPERTAGLVVVDGALAMLASPEQMKQFAAPLYTDEWQEYAVRMFDGMSAAMAHEEDRALVRRVLLGTSREGVRGGFDAMYAPDIWDADPIEAPLLVVVADSSGWPEGYEETVRGLNPGVRFVEMEGVSHFLMMDDPEGFNDLVEGWLEQRGL